MAISSGKPPTSNIIRPGLDNCHPVFHITFTFTHTGFGWFVGIRFIRENPDPDFTTAFHFTHDGAAGSFDLAGGNPTWFQRLQAIFTES